MARPFTSLLCLFFLLGQAAFGEVQWSAPVLLEADTGRYSSLEAGPGGTLHLAFYDYLNGDLRYAVRSADGDWAFETVDSEGDAGWFASLELDAAGVPHIAYCRFDQYMLKYAVRQGPDEWAVQVVDADPGRGWYSSLALDSAGNPHIAYTGNDQQEWDLRRAWYDPGSGWQFETIESVGKVGLYCALTLTAGDQGRISYFDKDNTRLKFAWQQPGEGWVIDVVDESGDVGVDTTIDLDDQGRPHVAYWDRGNDAVKYAWHDGAEWHVEEVSRGENWGYEACIVWEGGPHISYGSTEGAHYGEKIAGVWESSDVAPEARGGDTALVLEGGHPRMTYLNLDDGGLYYAEGTFVPTPGDANLDGVVDGADYTLWSDHYEPGVPGKTWEQGDFTADTIVDGADYTLWSDNFEGGGAAVPEPAMLGLLAVGVLGLIRRPGA